MRSPCTIEGCTLSSHARGLCITHARAAERAAAGAQPRLIGRALTYEIDFFRDVCGYSDVRIAERLDVPILTIRRRRTQPVALPCAKKVSA